MRWMWILGLLVMSVVPRAFADCQPTVCDNVYVQKLYVNMNGRINIGTSGDETKLNCTPGAGVYVYFNADAPGAKEAYATLLAAQMSEKKVFIRIDEGSQGCSVNYIMMDRQ